MLHLGRGAVGDARQVHRLVGRHQQVEIFREQRMLVSGQRHAARAARSFHSGFIAVASCGKASWNPSGPDSLIAGPVQLRDAVLVGAVMPNPLGAILRAEDVAAEVGETICSPSVIVSATALPSWPVDADMVRKPVAARVGAGMVDVDGVARMVVRAGGPVFLNVLPPCATMAAARSGTSFDDAQ